MENSHPRKAHLPATQNPEHGWEYEATLTARYRYLQETKHVRVTASSSSGAIRTRVAMVFFGTPQIHQFSILASPRGILASPRKVNPFAGKTTISFHRLQTTNSGGSTVKI